MKQNNPNIERFRLTAERITKRRWNPRFASQESDGNNGMFLIPSDSCSLLVKASDGGGWEHVSVTVFKKKRCPTWEEMCQIKNLFWDEDEVVIQYHPAQNDYISNHDFCLHMWKPVGVELPTPPPIFVGTRTGVTH
jgi:hypothetical protein